jgi:hypothetical protein
MYAAAVIRVGRTPGKDGNPVTVVCNGPPSLPANQVADAIRLLIHNRKVLAKILLEKKKYEIQ